MTKPTIIQIVIDETGVSIHGMIRPEHRELGEKLLAAVKTIITAQPNYSGPDIRQTELRIEP